MSEIESTFCVDTTREWISDYGDSLNTLAQQLDCALPARFRGQVLVSGTEPGAPGYIGSLPTCNPAPMAAFYVKDFGDTDSTYASILPGCSRVLKQNGCSNTTCNPLDTTLTTPYPSPAGVTPPVGTVCVQFNGCPVEYPVVFCVTYDQDHSDDQNWGVVKWFWDFIHGSSPPLCPAGQGSQNGSCAPCPAGEAACGGFCVDEQTDPSHCGGCGQGCPTGAACGSGACVCSPPSTLCNGFCADEQTDPSNCASCGQVCPAGASCQSGVCACGSGDAVCAGACVNERTDPNNCGACGTVCPAQATCEGGICVCSSGETLCTGVCVDEQSDPTNCGGCGVPCDVCNGSTTVDCGRCLAGLCTTK
jgi:hypothetical protein